MVVYPEAPSDRLTYGHRSAAKDDRGLPCPWGRRSGSARQPYITSYIALIRAVNVGGTGKLPMSELKSICEDAGFLNVQTYIARGNIVFESKASESKVKSELEARLRTIWASRQA